MRFPLAPLCALALLVTLAAADEIVLQDGTVHTGTVERVKLVGHEEFTRDKLYTVRLDGDRLATDARWIERLLRFALARERKGVAKDGKIGVYLGRGAFPPSAIAVVRRLDEAGRAPRLLFEDDMTKPGLAGLDAIVVPGGWAPSQRDGMGTAGQAALAQFVKAGGNYLGICAGGYLACSDVVWEGDRWPYPLRLATGTATGPVNGRAPWPTAEIFPLTLADGSKASALYAGGSSFEIDGATVLARYPGGSVAAVELRHGKGRLLLTGAHVELRSKVDTDLLAQDGWAAGLEPGDTPLFDVFLKRLLK